MTATGSLEGGLALELTAVRPLKTEEACVALHVLTLPPQRTLAGE